MLFATMSWCIRLIRNFHNCDSLLKLSMSVLANFSILSSGMGLGFPAITFQSLTNKSDPMALTNEQASWFGEFYCDLTKFRFSKKSTIDFFY